MKHQRFQIIQNLRITLKEAWEFFSNPFNLIKITPKWMDFRITNSLPDVMYPGMIITYKIKPLLGIPTSWVTEITQIQEPYLFIDEQRAGPYRFWHHQHTFKEIPHGIQMEDLIHYSLKFGYIGSLANALFVRRQIQAVFNFRKKILDELFNQKQTLFRNV